MWSHVITSTRGFVTWWVEASHSKLPLAKFGDHRHFCSRDITDLMFQVTLEDRLINGLYEFMEGISSLYVPTPSGLVTTDIAVVDISWF